MTAFGVFVNFEQISHIVLVLLLLTLNKNTGWEMVIPYRLLRTSAASLNKKRNQSICLKFITFLKWQIFFHRKTNIHKA